MLSDYFVKQGIKENEIEEFIKKQFPSGDYSRIILERTPLGLKVVIYTNKPGRIIGRGGQNINEMTDALKERFKLENPQLDVKSIDNPNLDASIVAKQIASALERGYNYKKMGNLAIKRIMDSGAVGAQIIIAGKLGGSKGLSGKFTEGYLKHCGQSAKELVDYGFQEADTRPGKIGVKVKIMKEFVDISGAVVEKKTDSMEPEESVSGEVEAKTGEPEGTGAPNEEERAPEEAKKDAEPGKKLAKPAAEKPAKKTKPGVKSGVKPKKPAAKPKKETKKIKRSKPKNKGK